MTQRTSDLSISWRMIGPSDQVALDALYDLAFGIPSGAHFTDDFPCWSPLQSVPDRIQMGGFIGNRLVASASSRICEVLSSKTRMTLIGGVVVHPEFRGQGAATEGIQQLLSNSDSSGVEISVLWGSEKTLYSRFGFTDAGVQKRAPLSVMSLTAGTPGEKFNVEVGFSPAVAADLLKTRNEGVALKLQDIPLIEASKNIQWMRVQTETRSAFIAVGKGVDLPGMVHTWGGDPSLLMRLLFVLKTQVSEHIEMLWHPSHERKYPFLAAVANPAIEVLMMWRNKKSKLDPDTLWFWGTDSC